MSFSIQVVRSAQQPVVNGTSVTYSFTLTASSGHNVPNQIFRMRTLPLDPVAQTTATVFDGVCTPYDLTILPTTEPVAPNDLWRTDVVMIVYTDIAAGEADWTEIQFNIQLLLNSLAAQAILANPQTVNFTAG